MYKPPVEESQAFINEEFRGDIERIMKRFDFERVHSVMDYLNWSWHNGEGARKVPTIDQLRSSALKILGWISKEKVGSWTSTGGFMASKDKGEFGVQLDLKFVLCSWDGKDFQV